MARVTGQRGRGSPGSVSGSDPGFSFFPQEAKSRPPHTHCSSCFSVSPEPPGPLAGQVQEPPADWGPGIALQALTPARGLWAHKCPPHGARAWPWTPLGPVPLSLCSWTRPPGSCMALSHPGVGVQPLSPAAQGDSRAPAEKALRVRGQATGSFLPKAAHISVSLVAPRYSYLNVHMPGRQPLPAVYTSQVFVGCCHIPFPLRPGLVTSAHCAASAGPEGGTDAGHSERPPRCDAEGGGAHRPRTRPLRTDARVALTGSGRRGERWFSADSVSGPGRLFCGGDAVN